MSISPSPGERDLTLFVSGEGLPDALVDAIRSEDIVVVPLREHPEALDGDTRGPAVLLHGVQESSEDGHAARTPNSVVPVTLGSVPNGTLSIDPGADIADSLAVLRLAFEHSAALCAARRAEEELERSRAELRELNRIGMALMTERDLDRLLAKIVRQSIELTTSDAASLYLLEPGPDGTPALRFAHAYNRTLPELGLEEFVIPVDRTSIAGCVAVTGDPLRIDDAYRLPEDVPYTFNHSFDERFGYRARSILAVPMLDHRGESVGVLQLINRKRRPEAPVHTEADADAVVLPYGNHHEELVQSLAGQAAVSVENSRLYAEIERLFESFVTASVSAVEERDPTTAGHSVRVAALCTSMAELLPRLDRGPHAGARLTQEQLRELRYAALLHDFGKVGVREEVLVKAKKLPPSYQERVEARFALIRRTIESELYRDMVEGRTERIRTPDELRAELAERLEEIDTLHGVVRQANQPSLLAEEVDARLDEIVRRTFPGPDGTPMPYLTEEEYRFLKIPKGTLDAAERGEIESHVERTYRFLQRIPWTTDLGNVAEIAYGHHEKLDGRGYPRGVTEEEIPLQTRIMTIADIFDALTASDRPYKRAVPVDRATEILRMEAGGGMLDSDLVEFFIESEAYRIVLERDWRELAAV